MYLKSQVSQFNFHSIIKSFTKKKLYLRNYVFALISFGEEECTTHRRCHARVKFASCLKSLVRAQTATLMSRDLYLPSTLAVTWHLYSKISRQWNLHMQTLVMLTEKTKTTLTAFDTDMIAMART